PPSPPLLPYTTLFRSQTPPAGRAAVAAIAGGTAVGVVRGRQAAVAEPDAIHRSHVQGRPRSGRHPLRRPGAGRPVVCRLPRDARSEEHTSELQSPYDL